MNDRPILTLKKKPLEAALEEVAAAAKEKQSKLDTVTALLSRPEGATIADMVAATGWQKHTVRGVMSNLVKKRGLKIVSDKPKGESRIYKIAE